MSGSAWAAIEAIEAGGGCQGGQEVPCRDGRGRRRQRNREPVAFADLTEPAGGYGPLALPLPAAAELLGVPLARVRAAASGSSPMSMRTGSGRWSLRLLERELGPLKRSGPGSAWRGAGNRANYRHEHGPDG